MLTAEFHPAEDKTSNRLMVVLHGLGDSIAGYRWLGELSREKALRLLSRCRLLALTSEQEGGANVVSEALAASVPVLSSRIAGSVGLLGEDYPGYFPVGDTEALARLLGRAETDADFYQTPYGLFAIGAQAIRAGHQVKVLNLSGFAWDGPRR